MNAEILKGTAPAKAYLELDIHEWPDVDPATVIYELGTAAKDAGFDISQHALDKAMAIQTCLTSDMPYTDPYVFEKVVESLNGRSPAFGVFPTLPQAHEVALALKSMQDLRPDAEFGVGVKRYAREILRHYGVADYPESFGKAKLNQEECVNEQVEGACITLRTEIRAGQSAMAKVQLAKLEDIANYVKERS